MILATHVPGELRPHHKCRLQLCIRVYSLFIVSFRMTSPETLSDDEGECFYDADDGTNDIQKTWDELMV